MDELRCGLLAETVSPEERVWLDDACLMRYLVARDMKPEPALAMLKNSLKWRRDFGVTALLKNPGTRLKNEAQSGKIFVHGKDRCGRPIVVMRPRHENSKDHDGQMELLVYTLERAVSCMEAGVDKLMVLIDFKGMGVRNNPPMSTQQETLAILHNHYPERLGLALLCSAPALFHGVFRIINPFIEASTREKIQWAKNFEPSSADGQRLNHLVAPDNLMADYGGTSSFVYSNEAYFVKSILL